jgi:hypothetical protein
MTYSLVLISNLLALMCHVKSQSKEQQVEKVFQAAILEYGSNLERGAPRIVLVRQEDAMEAVKVIVLYGLLSKFDMVAIFKPDPHGFEVIYGHAGNYRKSNVIKRNEIVARP